MDLVTRFWAKVEVRPGDGCWLWKGSTWQNGYGMFYIDGKMRRAHRVSWELAHGPIPPDVLILHNCDDKYPPGDVTYRRCVRPDHLFQGSDLDNMRDMIAKGRDRKIAPYNPATGNRNGAYTKPESRRKGETNGRAKVTAEQVAVIRQRAAAGESKVAIGRDYGLSGNQIGLIASGRNWREE